MAGEEAEQLGCWRISLGQGKKHVRVPGLQERAFGGELGRKIFAEVEPGVIFDGQQPHRQAKPPASEGQIKWSNLL